MRDELQRLIVTARVLYVNSVGCLVHHQEGDREKLPPWLLNCWKDIEAAERAFDESAGR